MEEARLAEQHKLEGLLTSHRSDLDKKQAKLQAALETHISTVVKKDEARLADQQKLEDLLTSHGSDLDNIKATLETHISTVVQKDETRLAEQQKLESLLTSHRSDLDTHISTVVEKDKARLTEQQKHEDLVTGLRGQFENFKQMTETAFTGVSDRMKQQNSLIGADIDKLTGCVIVRDDNILSKLKKHEDRLNGLRIDLEDCGKRIQRLLLG